ncbi:MAG: hypothetical protein ACM3ST_16610 [Bdellovibrio bacteriovorus]
MIFDTLTLAGIIASTFYLLTFLVFGKETLKVEEPAPGPEVRSRGRCKTPCPDY